MVRMDAAVRDPSTVTIERRPRSVRRTSHMDMRFCDDGHLELEGGARDLRTDADGAGRTLAEAHVRALVGTTRRLEELESTPAAATDALIGVPVAGGFRAAVDRAVPSHREEHSPLYLLLDELPVAALISGYATLYLRNEGRPTPGAEGGAERRGPRSDICAGWRSDGVMMTAIDSGAGVPTPVGPRAPVLEVGSDPLGWHPIPALPAGAMRRRRLIDVAADRDDISVGAMFRDTHVDESGMETVLHEYEIEMAVDATTMTVRSCQARPRTLPWPECPAAADSAGRLAGHRVGDLRSLVRAEFHGTSTCTHLNDLLRSLGDVGVLTDTLA